MTNADATVVAAHSKSSKRGQGHKHKQRYQSSTAIFLVSVLGLVTLLRLTVETSLIRNHLFQTTNEQTHYHVGDLDSSHNQRNQTLNSTELNQYSLNNHTSKSIRSTSRSFTRDPTTICSGSTFQSVPSATNLLLPSPRRKQLQHRCYETSHDDTFFDRSTTEHNYSDTNYVFHILGGGKCNPDGFESLPRDASKNIIVTAYYEIPSKHPPQKYREWMGNFLSVYQDPIVIFTSPNLVDLLADLRRRNTNETTNACDNPPCGSLYFDTILIALPLEELPLAKLYPKSFWVDQLDRDPQAHIHSPLRGDPRMQGQFESGELYWIWLSKIWFVVEATRILGLGTDWNETPNSGNYDDSVFAWIDIGSFRNKDQIAKNENDPPLLLRHPEVVPSSEMLFWSHSSAHSSQRSDAASTKPPAKTYAPIPPQKSPYFDDKSLEGGKYFFHSDAHFAGRPQSIARFYRQFLHTIDVFVERNLTLADDQAVMQSSCLSFSYERFGDDQRGREFDEQPDNLCAYATRDMVGGKSKWFGLTKLLQNGWANTRSQNTRSVGTNPYDLYWTPPPPEYYLEDSNESLGAKPNCSHTSSIAGSKD